MGWRAWMLSSACLLGAAQGAQAQKVPAAPLPLPSAPIEAKGKTDSTSMLKDAPAPGPTFATDQLPAASPDGSPVAEITVPKELIDAEHWPGVYRRNDYRSTYMMGGIGSALSGVTSLTTAVASRGTGVTGGDSYTNILIQQSNTFTLLPGLFTVMNAESARPIDRVFFGYGYDFHIRAIQSTFLNTGLNLNQFDVGVEKTFFDGDASIYVRVPYLSASNNSTNQPITGLGDVSLGLKYALHANPETGSVLSVGFTTSFATARTQTLTSNTFVVTSLAAKPFKLGIAPPPGAAVSNPPPNAYETTITSTINPTFLQPYVTGTFICGKYFFSNYLGLVYSTDDRVSSFINDDVGMGYRVYTKNYGIVRGLTPTLDLQFITPLNHQGVPIPYPNAFSPAGPNPTSLAAQPTYNQNTSTQVFVGLGGQANLWEHAILSAAWVLPVAGPKSFNVGATIGLNILY